MTECITDAEAPMCFHLQCVKYVCSHMPIANQGITHIYTLLQNVEHIERQMNSFTWG